MARSPGRPSGGAPARDLSTFAVDFFETQDRARRLSRRLVALYGLAVAGLILGVYLVALVALGYAGAGGLALGPGLFRPDLFLAVALGMGVLIGGGASFRTAQLRQGGSAVARLLGGRRVDPGTGDPKEQVLLNVVEEMAIASGVPVPEVFVLDRESGINAFAAGHTLNDAAVAVTRGALDAFTRDELQGVMAHEFSHILNGDMRLNIRLMGILFGILLLTVVGRGVLRGSFYGGGVRRSGGRDGRSGGQVALIGLALVILGYLGVVVGRLIQAAVSRQREYLADAAAVQFTRNPEGIAGALKRIGASKDGSRLADHHAEEASHLFFARGVGRALTGLTATHPPLPDRIRRIEPGWNGTFEVRPSRSRAGLADREPTDRTPTRSRPADAVPAADAFPGGGAALLAAILASAGTLGAGQLAEARRLLAGVPEEARRRLRTPEGAVEGVLALLLSDVGAEPAARERADQAIARRLGDRTARGAAEFQAMVAAVGAEGRLPVFELALPALRQLPRERAAALRAAVGEVIRADGEVRPFEYAAYHLMRRNLPAEGKEELPSNRPGVTPLSRLGAEVGLVLSALAWSGAGTPTDAETAFRAGVAALARGGARPSEDLRLLPRGAVGLDAVDAALARLEGSAPAARKELLAAATAVVTADGRVGVQEAELLRAFAEALEVPVPPLPPPATGAGGPPVSSSNQEAPGG
jgi:Zn-dependent protease with chaperone function/uncharacterized tellurite resistance protein B-like protein